MLAWCKTAVKGMFPTLKKDTNVLVVDFGGGTLDFSVIRYLGNGRFKVEDNAGMFFDEKDIDNAIMDLVLAELRNEYGVEIDKSKKRMVNELARLRNICEDAKIEVNNRTKDNDRYEGFLKKNENLVYEIDVSYLTTEIDAILLPFREVTDAIMKCMEFAVRIPLEHITSKPGQMPWELQHVLLVGKATQLVVFRQLLYREQLQRKRFEKIDAMNCVSQGLYELACIMNDPNTRMSMSDPIAVSYGLRAGSDKVAIILRKGTILPCTSREIIFCNCDDYSERINISVFQCADDEGKELVDIEKCTEVESWQFINPEDCRRPKGQQQLTLCLKLEVGGTLQVICKDFAYNRVLLNEKTGLLYEGDYCVYYSLV